jgi:hypothetical protein
MGAWYIGSAFETFFCFKKTEAEFKGFIVSTF